MEIQLKIIGVLLIALALLHAVFPAYFRWSKDLAGLQPINRQMMYVHAFFIALDGFLDGPLVPDVFAGDHRHPAGKKGGLRVCRFLGRGLLVQFFGYSSSLWRGKTFETVVHVVFAVFWTYLATMFSAIAWAPARTMPW